MGLCARLKLLKQQQRGRYLCYFFYWLWTLLILSILPEQVQASSKANLKVVYAVNAGGFEHTDKNGIHYEADPLHSKIGTASDYGNHLLIIGRVPEQDEILYRTERYHTATFGYDLPIDDDGDYALIMKFCEVYFNEPNMKVFDVVLNKKHIIVSELDIFHQVGRGTAHEEYAFFTVSDGILFYKDEDSVVENGKIRLEFIKSNYDNPKINAFALLKGDVEHIPRLAPITDDMAVFHDRVSADGPNSNSQREQLQQPMRRNNQAGPSSAIIDSPVIENTIDEDDSSEIDPITRSRKTSGPRQPNPYGMDDSSSIMLPVFIAIGAFIPLLFCLCKL